MRRGCWGVKSEEVKHLDKNKVRSLWLSWRGSGGCLEGTGRQAPAPRRVEPFTIFPVPPHTHVSAP